MERTCSLGRSFLTMAAIAAVVLAPIPRLAPAAGACWWPDPPLEQDAPGDAEDVPALPDNNPYLLSQGQIIAGAFCTNTFSGLSVFTLEDSALATEETSGTHASLGAVEWKTLHSSPYDWQAAGPTLPGVAMLTSADAEIALVIGELEGSCAAVACIAVAFDLDGSSGREHYLVPLVLASSFLHDVALTARPMPQRAYAVNPCDSDTYCDDTYRDRLSQGLDAFAQCMKDSVPPVSIWNVVCFAACLPFLAGSPIAYALCCLACNTGVSAGGVINYVTCENELKAAKENALASYCACLAYKEAKCPGMAETDTHGCP